jgi:hypothetical protein
MKLLLLTTLVAAISLSSAASIGFRIPRGNCANHPNGTDSALHAFDGTASDQMDLVSISVTDNAGNPVYPVAPKKPIVVTVVADYKGGPADNIKLDVKLAHWGDMSGSCSWDAQIVPFLNNLDGCPTTSCPINSGRVTFKLPLDLSPIAGIIDAFGHNQVFQISVYVMDSTDKTQLGLGIAQVLVNDP